MPRSGRRLEGGGYGAWNSALMFTLRAGIVKPQWLIGLAQKQPQREAELP